MKRLIYSAGICGKFIGENREIPMEEELELIAEAGFDPTYGARPLRRAIVRLIEDAFSTELLEGRIKRGDHVVADVQTAEDGKASIVFRAQSAEDGDKQV